MASYEEITKKVLMEIKPSELEQRKMKSIIKRVEKVTESIISEYNLKYTISGSYIRDTWLSDKKEFDLFVLFPEDYPRKDFENIGLLIGKAIIDKMNGIHEIAYAEHPYTKGIIEGYSIDIVPCYDVKDASKIKSSVDRTPFHNRYMKKHITKKLSDDVRLLKRFTKSIGVYGSDIKTQGFSGYLCEILILKYNNFTKLVHAASKWKPQIFIDIENHCKIDNVKKKFSGQPLIVIDPTDLQRNVAAALSIKNFITFVHSCESFVKKPTKKIFFLEKSKIDHSGLIKQISNRKTTMISLCLKRPDSVDDVLWSQLRKTSKRLCKLLESNDFELIGFADYADESTIDIIFEFVTWKLPEIKKLRGPPVLNIKHSKQFINKYVEKGRVFVEEDYYCAEIIRKFKTPKELLKSFLSASPKDLIKKGIASKLAESMETFKIYSVLYINRRIKNDAGFRRNLYKYINERQHY